MKNRILIKLTIIFFFNIFVLNFANSEQFSFDVTEIEILDNGNLFKGLKRGIVKTDTGININADTFIYNKLTNILTAEGIVKIEDTANNYVIYSNKATYQINY